MENNTIRKLIALEIKNDEMIMAQATMFKETVKSFDGKVFNIRLEKALREKTGLDFSVERKEYFETFELSVWLDDRSVQTENHTVYIDYSQVYIGNFWDKNFVNDDNRINADVIITEFENWVEKTKKANQEKLAQIEQLEELQKQREEMMETIDNYNKKINHNIDSYAKLRINVRY